MLCSIFKQSFIKEFNLFSFQCSSINFPLIKEFFILFGNLSSCLIISSFKNISSNLLSTSDNKLSSLLFNSFLNFVNIFWIVVFNFSLSSFIFSNNFFKSSIDCLKLVDKSSKIFIFSFNLDFFSFSISSIRQTLQSLCCPFFLS